MTDWKTLDAEIDRDAKAFNEKARESELSADAGSAPLPQTPPDALLHSMAVRYDHGLAIPGHYDTNPDTDEGGHERRYRATITTMRQLYEEVSGHGFYEWPNSAVSQPGKK